MKTAYRDKLMGRCLSKPIPVDQREQWVEGDIVDFVRNPGPVLEELQARMKGDRPARQSLEQNVGRLDAALQRKQREGERVIALLRKEVITYTEG